MAEPRGSARRTNLALGLAALLILGASIAVSVLVDSSPATAPSDITVAPNSPGSATRPADTWLSWFDHANVVEQFDHPMETLRCEYLDQYLTNDVCAVAATRHGAFMISGAERDWDPEEMDEDGRAYVPFSLTAWVLRSDGTRRAASILDGWTEKAFSPLAVSLSLHVAEVDGDQVILIMRRRRSLRLSGLDADHRHVPEWSPHPRRRLRGHRTHRARNSRCPHGLLLAIRSRGLRESRRALVHAPASVPEWTRALRLGRDTVIGALPDHRGTRPRLCVPIPCCSGRSRAVPWGFRTHGQCVRSIP